jgi:hypothetical protein
MISNDFDDILDSGDVTLSQGSSFQGESDDEFDATALLSEPLFVNGDGEDDEDNPLDLSSSDIIDLDPNGSLPIDDLQQGLPSVSSSNNNFQGYPGHNMPDSHGSSLQQSYEQQQESRPPMRGLRPPPSFMSQNQQLQQQQQQHQNQFSSSFSGRPDQGIMGGGGGGIISHNNTMDSSMQSTHQQQQQQQQQQITNVDQRMMEVQQKIQHVQQQIHQVQFQASSPIPGQISSSNMDNSNNNNVMMMMMNPNLQSPRQQQQQQMMQGGGVGNMAGMTRTPPGRSISMPAQRMMNLPTSPFSNSFVMQQQQSTLNAMSQSQGMSQNFNNISNNNQGMNMNNPGMNMNQHQMMSSMNSQGMNQSTNQMMINQNQGMNMSNHGMNQSLNNSYSDHGGLVRQQPTHTMMDLSSRSVPTEINASSDPGMTLAMMQQATMPGAVRNNSLPMRNNSLPRTGSGNPSMQGGGGGGFDLSLMAQSYAASQGAGGAGQPSNVNEAMEKLCESMRRSAMSRTLVKQLSGRTINRAGSGITSLNRAGSGRGVQRANSGRQRDLVRANSGRQLSRANSGKAIQRTHSGAQQFLFTSGNDGTGELQPIRRMSQDPKNRMIPSRGVFRNHSTTAAMGMHDLAAMQQQLRLQQSIGHSSLHNINNPTFNMNDGSGNQNF